MLTLVLSSLRSRWSALAAPFVALALGAALVATMGLGLASSFDAPERGVERFASSPVIVKGRDTLTVPGEHRPLSKPLAHPHPVDNELLAELRTLGPVVRDANPDAVGVSAEPAAVRRLVGDRAQVLTGDDRRRANPDPHRDDEALMTVNALLGTSGGVAAFVSVFVTASAFAFAVALRRRELGLLRATGATPGQVRRMLLAEAAVVGALASAAGCALGRLAAPWLARALVDGGHAPHWFTIKDAAWPLHTAFWTGVAVALAGAWAAARRAGRTGPLAALREADVEADALPLGRRLAGFALLACALGLLAWTLWTDPSGLLKRKTYVTQPMVLITAAAALAPLLVRPVARLLRLPGATGMLVRAGATASRRRTAAVAAPALVTVALAGSLLGSAQSVAASKAAEARARTGAELVVTGRDLKPVAVPGATLSPTASTALYVREEGTALVASEARAVADPAAFAALTRLPVVAGDVRDLDDRSVIVNEEWAGHTVGESVDLWRGDGSPATLRIVAVLAEGTGDNGAYVTAANAPGARVDRIEATLPAGADPRALAATGGEVRTAEAWLSATRPGTGAQTRLSMLLILGIALVYAVLSLVGTLLMAVRARAPELAALRLAGATRGQVRRVAAGEALFAVAVGVVLGAAVTAVNLGGLGTALSLLGAPVRVRVPWETAAVALTCAAVAYAVPRVRR
ncbi:FtsX-like permease family protein [Streptomyces sp. NPDC050504]|uniref:ABC transporter permease n=1 Tax=Streptomyces sp. NPDC050504 TaxID=3365618 RepID=UPI0037A020A8